MFRKEIFDCFPCLFQFICCYFLPFLSVWVSFFAPFFFSVSVGFLFLSCKYQKFGEDRVVDADLAW